MDKSSSNKTAEESALKAVIPVGLLCGLFALVFNFSYPALPIWGIHSVAFPMLISALFISIFTFIYGYLKGAHIKMRETGVKISERKLRFYAVILSLMYGLLTSGITILLAVLLNNAFKGLTLDPYISAVICGIYGSMIVYFFLNYSIKLSMEDVITGLGVFLIGGVLISMISVDDPTWWERNFSFLGTPNSGSYLVFNVTLVLAALSLLVVIEYLFEGQRQTFLKVRKVSAKKYNFTKGLFIFMALAFAGIGLFPWKGEGTFSALMHNVSVDILAVCLFFTLVFIRWLIPILPKHFYNISYLMGAMFAVATALFIVFKYFNQTAFELTCFFISGIWILLFLRNMRVITGRESG